MSQADDAEVKLDCPACGRTIKIPFYRGSLVAYKHNHGDSERHARFMVSVDPRGDDHTFRVLERNEKFEEVYMELWPDHQRRVRKAVLAVCMMQQDDCQWAA